MSLGEMQRSSNSVIREISTPALTPAKLIFSSVGPNLGRKLIFDQAYDSLGKVITYQQASTILAILGGAFVFVQILNFPPLSILSATFQRRRGA